MKTTTVYAVTGAVIGKLTTSRAYEKNCIKCGKRFPIESCPEGTRKNYSFCRNCTMNRRPK